MTPQTLEIAYTELLEVDLSPDELSLCKAAQGATTLAYAPYSKFRVGAAARLGGGKIVSAANLENAAYPQCMCAEATLLGTLHTQYHQQKIEAIAVAVDANRPSSQPAAPCGSCRQQLFEAEHRQGQGFAIYLANADGSALRFEKAADLLPFGFML